MRYYSDWAVALAKYYFGPDKAGQKVRLAVSRALLDSVFIQLGGTRGFIDSMREGPDFIQLKPSLLERLHCLNKVWNFRRANAQHVFTQITYPDFPDYLRTCPPFLPYLAMFVLAWDNDFEIAGYYDRLNDIYPDHGLQQFANGTHPMTVITDYWNALKNWSQDSNVGELDVFQFGGNSHIGIPRSQIVFPPRYLQRLPFLFSKCYLRPENALNQNNVRTTVLNAPEYLRTCCLGPAAKIAIEQPDNPIQGAVLNVLCDNLAEWDETVPQGLFCQINANPRRAGNNFEDPLSEEDYLYIPLKLAIRGGINNRRIFLTVSPEFTNLVNPGTDYSFGNHRFRFCNYMNSLVLALPVDNPQAADFEAVFDAFRENPGEEVTLVDANDSSAADRISPPLVLPSQNVRFFVQQGFYLVETEQGMFPPEGTVFVLYLNDNGNNLWWRNWFNGLPRQVTYEHDETEPVPGYVFTQINNVGEIAEHHLNIIGIHQGEQRMARPRYLSIRGGSRVFGAGINNSYLPYDLPMISLFGGNEIQLIAENDAITITPLINDEDDEHFEIGGEDNQGEVINVRYFTLSAPRAARVTFRAERDGQVLDSRTISIAKENDLPYVPNLDSNYYVGMEGPGRNLPKEGLQGAVLTDYVALPEELTDHPVELYYLAGNQLSVDNLKHHFPTENIKGYFKLTNQLAMRQRIQYNELKRFANRVYKNLSTDIFNRELQWLCGLGYADLLCGDKGRWAYVYAAPLTLYLLPARYEGNFLAVLTGCATHEIYRSVVEMALDHFTVYSTPQHCDIIPPRILLAAPEKQIFTGFIEELKNLSHPIIIRWAGNIPAAYKIAAWASDRNAWVGSLAEYQRGIEEGNVLSTYNPLTFKNEAGYHLPGLVNQNLSLHCMTNRETGSVERWYELRRRSNNGITCSFVSDRSWAVWAVQESCVQAVAPDLKAPVVYEAEAIVLPETLCLPYVLAKAALLCSGLVPVVRNHHDAYHIPGNGFVPALGYEGPCLKYQYIPRAIAELIINDKLGFALTDFPRQPAVHI